MTARSPRSAGLLRAALRHVSSSRAGARAMALGYFALTAGLGLSQRYLHDEGVFTLDQARLFFEAPGAIFFLLKAKPPLVILYALPAALGIDAFLVAHALVAALAVYLITAAARSAGIRAPNLAGWALIGSVSFTVGASNGYPNTDGAFFLALFLCLYYAERRALAALALGLLPLVRHELAAVTVVYAAWDLHARRDLRFVAWALLAGAIYGVAGAAYHGQPLWLIADFPDPSGLPQAFRVHRSPDALGALVSLRDGLIRNAPALTVFGVAAFARPRKRLAPLYVSGFLAYVGMTVLQVGGVLGFDTSPRYYLAPLPLLAMLAAAALDGPPRDSRPWLVAGGLSLLAASGGAIAAAAALAVVAAYALGARLGRRRIAAAVLVAASIPILGWQLTDDGIRERQQQLELTQLLGEMRARGLYEGEPLYTDFIIARYDRDLAGADVHLIVNAAIAWEAQSNLGERLASLLAAAEDVGIHLDARAHTVRAGAVYVLRDEERMGLWRERLEASGAERTRVGAYWVYRLNP